MVCLLLLLLALLDPIHAGPFEFRGMVGRRMEDGVIHPNCSIAVGRCCRLLFVALSSYFAYMNLSAPLWKLTCVDRVRRFTAADSLGQ